MYPLRMPGRVGGSLRRWGHRATALVTAVLAGGGLAVALAASPAAAAAPGPAHGATPSATQQGSTVYLAYTGTDRQVYVRTVTNPAQPTIALGGQLVGGPAAAIAPGSRLTVFGRGTDNALWWRYRTASGWSSWRSLGGILTSKPTAAGTGDQRFGPFGVFARGADGKVWYRTLDTNHVWSPWQALPYPDGVLLPGTAPGAGGRGSLLLAVTGLDRHVYVYGRTGTAYSYVDFDGRTTTNPAPTQATTDIIAVFARGTDRALWYRTGILPLAPTGPWHSLGGVLTSGVTATTVPGGRTYVFALGTDHHIWMRAGTLPTLGRWTRL